MSDPILAGLQVYVVGGAVRDELLGRTAGDRDWVVVGSSPEDMVSRGFIPVGEDFPVFLHPQTKEEYALARTERKSGKGYKGFTFYAGADVTLEDDLKRRDLTVNAMAKTPSGDLIDPLGGRNDLHNKVLRHIGPAFEEDPVRILRLARFAARFFEFEVAPETISLCRRMVALGEADALVPERVWQEVSRGLISEQPSRMFEVLLDCEALPVVMPNYVYSPQLGSYLDSAATWAERTLPGMYALCMHLTEERKQLAQRLRAPSDCAQWADLLPLIEAACRDSNHWELSQWPEQALGLLEKTDAIRRPDRLATLLNMASHLVQCPLDRWQTALQAARSIDAGAIAKPLQEHGPQAISTAVRAARREAIAQALASSV
ncbi:CCA tRNA nucleotidyltransferase [Orrella daihaiensis]|uniref:CCA tRNA nucleotidyltransferase n=1 Tax=Orrella daihaiensis TaxID=2782176 RepID=A0ABY4AJ53_9BURK|nr:CCA tRNA nucleotidyltransferase [Orrella daihaiensis]UOD50325.1 CCA tRNA nucleotidyltransferase [Orrella daihaiensis]